MKNRIRQDGRSGQFGAEGRGRPEVFDTELRFAAYFSGKPIREGSEAQNQAGALEEADIPIAHPRRLLSERGKRMPSPSVMRLPWDTVRIKLPVGDSPVERPFPGDAVTLEAVVLTADLEPWGKAESDMGILPRLNTGD